MSRLTLKINYRLDEFTIYAFGDRNGIPNGIFVTTKLPNEKFLYNREYLINYYSKLPKGPIWLDRDNCFIIDDINKIIFIPLTNRPKQIVDFAYTNLDNYDKIKGKQFYCNKHNNGKKYVLTLDHFTLHEIINGKKAEKGGWKLIENFDLLQKDYEDIKLSWHTSSFKGDENKQDDETENVDEIQEEEISDGEGEEEGEDEEMEEFIHEENVENQILDDEDKPHPNMGKDGDYYRSKSNKVYVKVPAQLIDHINSEGLDCRSSNIREISCGANAANRTKKAGTTSKYMGVCLDGKRWRGSIRYMKKIYDKYFDDEYDAAKFRDIYAVHLYKIIMSNNGTLSDDEIKDILNNGLQSFSKYKIEKKTPVVRTLPKYVYRDKDKFRVIISKENRRKPLNGKLRKTAEEAIADLPELLAKREVQRKEDEKKRVEQFEKYRLENTNDKYGYITTTNKNTIRKYKVNIELWEEVMNYQWNCTTSGDARTTINGDSVTLHLYVYKYYNEDYHRLIDGTVDHENRDKLDCTIESLRAATNNEQLQNRDMPRDVSCIPYQGVNLQFDKFYTYLKWKGRGETETQTFQSERMIYLEDAAREYNRVILEKWPGAKINIVPDTKTSVADLFHSDNITLEFIQNLKTIIEFHALFTINKKWAEKASITSPRKMKMVDIEKYREMAINFKTEDMKISENPALYVKSDDPFHKDNLTRQIINDGKLADLKRIFQSNKEWKTKTDYKIIIGDMRNVNLKIYKELANNILEEELKNIPIEIRNMPTTIREKDITDDPFHKNNLTIEKIDDIIHFRDILKLFQVNADWKKKGKVETSKMREIDMEYYIDIARNSKYAEMKEKDQNLPSLQERIHPEKRNPLHIGNLSIDDLKRVKTLKHMKDIMRTSSDWYSSTNYSLNTMNSKLLQDYIQSAIDFKNKYL